MAGVPPLVMLGPLALLIALGYLLPGALLALASIGLDPAGWFSRESTPTLAKYVALFTSPYYLRVLGYTLAVSLVVALATAVMAYPVAFYLARHQSRWNQAFFLITFTPLAVGMNMLTLGWLLILGKTGLLNSALLAIGLIDQPLSLAYGTTAVVIGLIHVTFTFMVLPLENVIRDIDPSLERAARNLGAGPVRTFLKITLPLSWEGLAAGTLIVFMQSCGAFVLPLLLGGSNTVMLPISVWEQMTVANDRAMAAAVAMLLIAVASVILYLQLRFLSARRSAVALVGG